MSPPNPRFDTEIRPYGKAAIEAAADLIRQGLPVAVPTETVYGLAADATDGEAVARIYEAKGRPSFNPLIVHVVSLDEAERIALFNAAARDLAERFWPGPLTLVLPLRKGSAISSLVTAGLPTIALRVPAHPAMQDLLEACGKPLAAPSANASGRISPTRAEHMLASLSGHIKLILDAGSTMHGLESTIVAVEENRVRILRPGPVLEEELGVPVSWEKRDAIESPGQLESHYAPTKPLRLDALEQHEDEWLIGFGERGGDSNLSRSSSLTEAAANLFDKLHEAEAQDLPKIAVAPLPPGGLGAALYDRLRRAAAPKKG